jgi:hypothetical protein
VHHASTDFHKRHIFFQMRYPQVSLWTRWDAPDGDVTDGVAVGDGDEPGEARPHSAAQPVAAGLPCGWAVAGVGGGMSADERVQP